MLQIQRSSKLNKLNSKQNYKLVHLRNIGFLIHKSSNFLTAPNINQSEEYIDKNNVYKLFTAKNSIYLVSF